MNPLKKKQFRRIAAGSDDEDTAKAEPVPAPKSLAPSIKSRTSGLPSRVSLRDDDASELADSAPEVRMRASGMPAFPRAPPAASGEELGEKGAGAEPAAGEYSADRIRALRAAQTFRLSVATSGAGSAQTTSGVSSAAGSESVAAAAGARAPVLVAVVEGATEAEPDDAMRQAALRAKAKREAARRKGVGSAGSALLDATASNEAADDFMPLNAKETAPPALAAQSSNIGNAAGRTLEILAAQERGDGASNAVAAPFLPALPQQPWPGASADPAGALRALRASLANAAGSARAAATTAEREVARISAEIEETASTAATARAAIAEAAAPSYDWYASLRAYAEELIACLREKRARVAELEAASDALEAAISQLRANRRSADLADEIADITENSSSGTLVSCGGTIPPPDQSSAHARDARRARRSARRARISALLRRSSRALAAGRVVGVSDLHALSDGDDSPTERSYSSEKRGDVARAARLLLSDVDARYSSVGSVLRHFGPWKSHRSFSRSYVDTLAGASLAELLAVLVRIDLAGSWAPLVPLGAAIAHASASSEVTDEDASNGARSGLGLSASAPAAPESLQDDPMRRAVAEAFSTPLRSASATEPLYRHLCRDAIVAAVAAAGGALTLDRFDWFRDVWSYGELPLAASTPSTAALDAEERLLPRVIQVSATSRLASYLRHAYNPASLVETSVAVAALKECLEYEPEAGAVTTCVAALATRLQVAVNDAVLPVLITEAQGHVGFSGVESTGGWHAVDTDPQQGVGGAQAVPSKALHNVTVLLFLQLVKLVHCISAWDFALAPALLRRLIETQCVGAIAGPLLAYTANQAEAACAAVKQDQRHSHEGYTAIASVNLHGAVVTALAQALPAAWWLDQTSDPCAGLPCSRAISLWLSAEEARNACGSNAASDTPVWLAIMQSLRVTVKNDGL
jgi:hypothetical protein